MRELEVARWDVSTPRVGRYEDEIDVVGSDTPNPESE